MRLLIVMRCFIFLLIFLTGCSSTVTTSYYDLSTKEAVVAKDILDLVSFVNAVPSYERKEIYFKLKETRYYILLRIVQRDKYPREGVKL